MPQQQRRQSPGKRRLSESQGPPESPGNPSQGNQPESPGNPGNPSPSESPNAAGAGSSQASYSASSPLLTNPGPAFDGRELVDEPDAGAAIAGDVFGPGVQLVELWTPERAEYLVKGQGAITHALIGVGSTDWVWQPAELAAVAPPLANSLNQVDMLRRLAPYADSIGALMGVAAYVGRSRRERAEVLAAGGPPVEVPASGFDAAGQAVDDAGDARRKRVLDGVLGRRRAAAPEPEQQPPADAGDAIRWRVGE